MVISADYTLQYVASSYIANVTYVGIRHVFCCGIHVLVAQAGIVVTQTQQHCIYRSGVRITSTASSVPHHSNTASVVVRCTVVTVTLHR